MTTLIILGIILFIVIWIFIIKEVKNAPIWDEDARRWITEAEFDERVKKSNKKL